MNIPIKTKYKCMVCGFVTDEPEKYTIDNGDGHCKIGSFIELKENVEVPTELVKSLDFIEFDYMGNFLNEGDKTFLRFYHDDNVCIRLIFYTPKSVKRNQQEYNMTLDRVGDPNRKLYFIVECDEDVRQIIMQYVIKLTKDEYTYKDK